ncbi:Transducin beta-like protein 2 [Irineochytrium annulatum]|nr:Transducin beta-like protein 2 [Irineochytrium annulatum]
MSEINGLAIAIVVGGLLAAALFLLAYQRTAKLAVASAPAIPAESIPATSLKPPASASKKGKNNPHHAAQPNSSPASKHAPKPTHALFLCQLRGHQQKVLDLRWHDSGVITCSSDGTVRLWDGSSFRRQAAGFTPVCKVVSLERGDYGTRVDVERDAKRFVIAGNRNLSMILFQRTGGGGYEVCWESEEQQNAEILSVGLGKGFCMSCDNGTSLHLVQLGDGRLLDKVRTNSVNNNCARTSPDGRFVALGGFLSEVRLWEVKSDRSGLATGVNSAMSLNGHKKGIVSLAFNGDASKILTLSRDGTVKLWNIAVRYEVKEDPKVLTTWEVTDLPLPDMTLLTMSADATTAAFVSGGSFALYSLKKSRTLAVVEDAHPGSALRGVEFSLDGTKVATISDDKVVNVWDVGEA